MTTAYGVVILDLINQYTAACVEQALREHDEDATKHDLAMMRASHVHKEIVARLSVLVLPEVPTPHPRDRGASSWVETSQR